MHVSWQFTPEPSDVERIQVFLRAILVEPNLCAGRFPALVMGSPVIFLNGKPTYLQSGVWEVSDEHIGLPASGTRVPLLTKLTVLSALAGLYGLDGDQVIVDSFQAALIRAITEGCENIYGNLVSSLEKLEQIAVNPATGETAVFLRGEWRLANGTVVLVGEEWTVMSLTAAPSN